ncbi:MAG: phosphoadenosine phosphosulfate reductase family protein [Christensenellaceae bacterium]|jgi:phosphoadenosine phosphosulfate reductase|nr:phosphoadenosine phosphosulfate reductase family protein [Christensenellaceae bacterium]
MYSYQWDSESGGLILNIEPSKLSREPRPVYYAELDTLGFDRYWTYEKNDALPYMWAESNNYIYRGKKVAQTHGGSYYVAPKIEIIENPEPDGTPLQFVNIELMVKKNEAIIDALANSTIKWIFNTYERYKSKVDLFYVAFSGGKDSIVLLDIVKKALSRDVYKVVFGDTQMEFPDTYELISEVEKDCKRDNIDFYIAQSHLDIQKSWETFGPPARTIRWCCSVHKTTPQILLLRELLRKDQFTGFAFLGVRGSESLNRSKYVQINLGKKHGQQYGAHPILDWNSAELYVYIYQNKLKINNCYKKGNSRAGCIICPMAQGKAEFMRHAVYPDATDKFIRIISEAYGVDEKATLTNIESNTWKQRRSGKMLSSLDLRYHELAIDDNYILRITNARTNWKEWIKTVGDLIELDRGQYKLLAYNREFVFTITGENSDYQVTYSLNDAKHYPTLYKLLKQVFRKAASCIACGECSANCGYGALKFINARPEISKCRRCHECHNIYEGCLLYNSTSLKTGGVRSLNNSKSIDRYNSHGPKPEWLDQFFDLENSFFQNNGLGSKMIYYFRNFLKDTQLIEDMKLSRFAEIMKMIDYKSEEGLGLLLINLAYSPQVGCFIKNIMRNQVLNRREFLDFMIRFGMTENSANHAILAFERLFNLFKPVGLCNVCKDGKTTLYTRSCWERPNNTVILYALYKFAEACDGYYQFTFKRLMDIKVDSAGITPVQIFGLNDYTMRAMLAGSSGKHPEFINYTNTLDLEIINLRSDKSSKDVLELFC